MIVNSKDYCPHCKRITNGLKDFEDKEYLCKRCERISKLNIIETFGETNKSPKNLKNSYLRWFRRRIV